jgi:hypothetical protein
VYPEARIVYPDNGQGEIRLVHGEAKARQALSGVLK